MRKVSESKKFSLTLLYMINYSWLQRTSIAQKVNLLFDNILKIEVITCNRKALLIVFFIYLNISRLSWRPGYIHMHLYYLLTFYVENLFSLGIDLGTNLVKYYLRRDVYLYHICTTVFQIYDHFNSFRLRTYFKPYFCHDVPVASF